MKDQIKENWICDNENLEIQIFNKSENSEENSDEEMSEEEEEKGPVATGQYFKSPQKTLSLSPVRVRKVAPINKNLTMRHRSRISSTRSSSRWKTPRGSRMRLTSRRMTGLPRDSRICYTWRRSGSLPKMNRRN